ncbi:hypothetical protein [Streptomyces kronopolitis]|uniref:hypothetical protein n=1 Tax=Streptomyces kronopolitis TaxID=1612435 RepID=UPI003D95F22D
MTTTSPGRLSNAGQPPIGDELRSIITAGSHRLPLYLDLSVMRFLEIRRTGCTPQPANFDHGFPALIACTLSDLLPTNGMSGAWSASSMLATSPCRPGRRHDP